jgi:hypothetical protein
MKKLVTALCVMFAVPAFADVEFRAKLQDNGEYCARVELEGPGAMRFTKVKCRTLEEWKQSGYDVKTVDGQEVEI